MKFSDACHRCPDDTTSVMSQLSSSLRERKENGTSLRPSALILSQRLLDITQPESDVFAEPDAWYSTQSLLGPYPGLGKMQMLGKLTCVQKFLFGVFTRCVVIDI